MQSVAVTAAAAAAAACVLDTDSVHSAHYAYAMCAPDFGFVGFVSPN